MCQGDCFLVVSWLVTVAMLRERWAGAVGIGAKAFSSNTSSAVANTPLLLGAANGIITIISCVCACTPVFLYASLWCVCLRVSVCVRARLRA